MGSQAKPQAPSSTSRRVKSYSRAVSSGRCVGRPLVARRVKIQKFFFRRRRGSRWWGLSQESVIKPRGPATKRGGVRRVLHNSILQHLLQMTLPVKRMGPVHMVGGGRQTASCIWCIPPSTDLHRTFINSSAFSYLSILIHSSDSKRKFQLEALVAIQSESSVNASAASLASSKRHLSTVVRCRLLVKLQATLSSAQAITTPANR